MIKEKAYFEKINGKKIFCIVTKPKNEKKKIVIISHGFRSSNIGSSRKFVILSRNLAKRGISSIRFDHFGSGNSEGDFYLSSFHNWVKTIRYLSKKYMKLNYKVGLMGSSMGATAIVKATEDKTIRNKMRGLVLWVPDPKIDKFKLSGEYMEEGGQRVKKNFWLEANKCDFLSNLKLLKNKYFIVYAKRDKYISRQSINSVMKIAKEHENDSLVLKKGNHDSWSFKNTEMVILKTTDFFCRVLEDNK